MWITTTYDMLYLLAFFPFSPLPSSRTRFLLFLVVAATCAWSCLRVPWRMRFSPSRTITACFLFNDNDSTQPSLRRPSSSYDRCGLSRCRLHKRRKDGLTSMLVGYSFSRASRTSMATVSTSMSTLGFGSLLFFAVLAHSSLESNSSLSSEISSSGSSQSVRSTKTLLRGRRVNTEPKVGIKCDTHSSSASPSHQSTRSCTSYLTFLETAATTRSARTSTTSSGLPVPDRGGRRGTTSTCPYRLSKSEFGGSPYVFHWECKRISLFLFAPKPALARSQFARRL